MASGGEDRWKHRIKGAVFFCLYYSGIEWLLARLIRADAAAILMYHGVCDQTMLPAHINFHLERDRFARQMRVLKRRYRVVPLSDVAGALARGERPAKSVVLTFDDGYRNNERYAAPVLSALGLPYTVFVATAYVESQRWMPLNEIYWLWSVGELTAEEMSRWRMQVRDHPLAESTELIQSLRQRRPSTVSVSAEENFAMLRWEEMRRMSQAGADFGSHTHSHCNMAAESTSQQCTELRVSRELLESRLERPARSFAYPYGRAEHTSEVARRNIIAAGYECAVSTEYGLVTGRSDRFHLPRLGHDRRIWMFAGEIAYQFAKQAIRAAWSRLAHRTPAGQRKASHG